MKKKNNKVKYNKYTATTTTMSSARRRQMVPIQYNILCPVSLIDIRNAYITSTYRYRLYVFPVQKKNKMKKKRNEVHVVRLSQVAAERALLEYESEKRVVAPLTRRGLRRRRTLQVVTSALEKFNIRRFVPVRSFVRLAFSTRARGAPCSTIGYGYINIPFVMIVGAYTYIL